MFPPLPQNPAPPQAVMGHQGGPPPQASGTIGGKPPSPVADVAAGLNSFMKAYFGTKAAKEQAADEWVTKTLSKLNAGLLGDPNNIDYDQIMKKMKDAKWPVKTAAPTLQESQFHADQKAYDAERAAQPEALTQEGTLNPAYQMLIPPTAPPPQAGPTGMAGILDRVKGMVGMSQAQRAPVSRESGMGQYLQQLAQKSWIGAPGNPQNVEAAGTLSNTNNRIAQLSANVKEAWGSKLEDMTASEHAELLGLSARARTGDPLAIEMAQRYHLMDKASIDEMTALYSHIDPTTPKEETYSQAAQSLVFAHIEMPMRKWQEERASKIVDRFAAQDDPVAASRAYIQATDAGQSPPIKPTMTLEEHSSLINSNADVMKLYPQTPLAWVNGWNTAKLTGDKEAQTHFSKLIGGQNRDGTQAQQNFVKTQGLEDYVKTNEVAQHWDQLRANYIQLALNAKGQEGEEIKMQLNSKDAATFKAGIARLNGLDMKGAMIQIPIPNPKDPKHPLMYTVTDPTRVMHESTGLFGLGEGTDYLEPTTSMQDMGRGDPTGRGAKEWQAYISSLSPDMQQMMMGFAATDQYIKRNHPEMGYGSRGSVVPK